MNKTILILGASSDIGLALIKDIYNDYDMIVAHYNSNSHQLDSLSKSVGEKLYTIQADFLSYYETRNLITKIDNEIGCPTHIVHLPANKYTNINFHKSNWEQVEADINISLRSIYSITQSFIKPMSANRYGKIVFMLTSNLVSPQKFMLDYTIVKYSLLGFMKSLAIEYADKHICINAVSPSMIDTKFLDNIPSIIVEKASMDNPLKRNATVEDIIPAIKFLLSEKSDYITGQNLVISGGSVI